jgi:hypothetical protein
VSTERDRLTELEHALGQAAEEAESWLEEPGSLTFKEAGRRILAMIGVVANAPGAVSPAKGTVMAGGTLTRLLAIIRNVDLWLDAEVAGEYAAQPLGQDWARVAKTAEEVGEAIAALIAMTGQNPRKGVCGTLDDLLGELGDTAVTAIFAIQHFTKNEAETGAVVVAAMEKAGARAEKAGYA